MCYILPLGLRWVEQIKLYDWRSITLTSDTSVLARVSRKGNDERVAHEDPQYLARCGNKVAICYGNDLSCMPYKLARPPRTIEHCGHESVLGTLEIGVSVGSSMGRAFFRTNSGCAAEDIDYQV